MQFVRSNAARSRFRFSAFILILLVAQPAIWAQSDDYALNLNSQWKLTNPYLATPFAITVAADSIVGGSRRVTLDFQITTNNYQYILIAKPDGLYFEGFRLGGNTLRLPQPAIFFPKSAVVGQAITTSYGSVTVVADNVAVADRNNVSRSTRHYRINWGSGGIEDWYLAPGFGPVQYAEGAGAFLYSTGTPKPPAVNRPPVYRVSACPPMSMMIDPVSTEAYSTQSLENKFKQVLALGASMVTIDTTWASLEPQAKVYNFTDITRQINWAKTYNTKVLLIIRTVDTLALSSPPDLQGKAINDATVIARFKTLLTKLAPVLAGRANFIELANEVDPYFQAHPDAIAPFKQFFNAGYSTIKALSPSSSVSLGFSYASTRMDNSAFLQLGALGDHVAFSYYPVGGDYRPMDLALIKMDFDDMLTAAGSRKLVLTEVGYPSSDLLGSSQQAQNDFVVALYQSIKNAGERLAGVNLFLMNDIAPAQCAGTSAYYGESETSPFVAFLSTLGFNDLTGNPKASWGTFVTQTPGLAGNLCQTTLP
jgi:hypothetical protein